ncbi:uncharacterized protein LOC128215604 [Mya arenaria]|uniref:uncharacterized protein LOC128215604 n=1 Tax=Mya arenaria TaxID=6604 RepID=UPI0022E66A62|nr:uncharacterized protein LOC128215604 [Mya arenaria]
MITRTIKLRFIVFLLTALCFGYGLMAIMLLNKDKEVISTEQVRLNRRNALNKTSSELSPELLPNMTFPFFEAEMHEDFPTLKDATPKIPHILHQTYKSEEIPTHYVPMIKSFLELHPNWTYYFWTEDSARRLLAKKYPYFLPIWDGYKDPMNRADALRYFVLYEYGGVYTDCDVRFLRPLDRATKVFSAILPLEPFEHSVFRLKMPFLTNNAIMMSRPRHPFFKLLMDSLKSAKNRNWMLVVAGPVFVNRAFVKYNNINQSALRIFKDNPSVNGLVPYNLQEISKYPMTHENHVLVPNTHFFLNTLAYKFDDDGVIRLCI